jgi:hypothetical protein
VLVMSSSGGSTTRSFSRRPISAPETHQRPEHAPTSLHCLQTKPYPKRRIERPVERRAIPAFPCMQSGFAPAWSDRAMERDAQ